MPARAVNNPNAFEITKRWLRPSREFDCGFRRNRTLNPELFAHSKSKEHWSKNILPYVCEMTRKPLIFLWESPCKEIR